MENQNRIQTLGEPEAMVLGPIPCNGAVCIPRTRYDELLRAEDALGTLRRAYQTMSGFTMDYIMDIIFDPALKYKPKATPGTEAGPEESAAGAE